MNTESPFAVISKHQNVLPVDLKGMADDFGILVYEADLGDDISGQISRDGWSGGESGFSIWINEKHHKNRKRFTFAHELAHFVLHRDLIGDGIQDDTMYRSSLGGALETQANRLAADILMPVGLVREKLDSGMSAADLAVTFGVSMAAMQIRLDYLQRVPA